MIPKKTEQPLYKQWTRQLKRCNGISTDHQIFANPSAEQAHPSEQFNPGLIHQANFNGVILASHQW
ncbi:hypothetical protein Q9966_011283 [Columba livia]|nr:hypothetical protein Q9966_011283 [Columba livia]